MTRDPRVFREKYHALADIKKIFEESSTAKSGVVDGILVREYQVFLADTEQELPGLLIPVIVEDYFSHNGGRGVYFRRDGLLAHISRNLSKLKVEVDDSAQLQVTETKSFHFISNDAIRKILERDYTEIQKSVIASNWKSVILLSGGSIEAILLDCLERDSASAIASSKAPGETDLKKWHLNDLIAVAEQENITGTNIAKLSHSVREYRNLIHPGVEIRQGLKVEPEEARIALEILNMLIRELS